MIMIYIFINCYIMYREGERERGGEGGRKGELGCASQCCLSS